MGVVITHDIADDFCALDGCMTFGQTHLPHGVKDTAVDGFQTVADIGDGASDVDTEGVLKICGMHDFFNIQRNVFACKITHFFSLSLLY